jgi:cytochrome oxidase Cu insertion factor (SCO1/SenC/PrrC family)
MTELGDEPRKNAQRRSTWWVLLGVLLLGLILAAIIVSDEATRTPQPEDEASVLSEDDRAPDFTLKAAEGGSVSLGDFHKKDVLLYFSMGPG